MRSLEFTNDNSKPWLIKFSIARDVQPYPTGLDFAERIEQLPNLWRKDKCFSKMERAPLSQGRGQYGIRQAAFKRKTRHRILGKPLYQKSETGLL